MTRLCGRQVICLWLLMTVAGCANPTDPTHEDFSDRTTYRMVVEVGGIVYTVKADGSSPMTIGQGLNEVLSPDGNLLAFRKILFDDLYVYSFSSGQTRQVLFETNWDRYAWSPAADRIVFSGPKDSTGYTVRIVNISSGDVIPVTDSIEGSQRYPHWLPDSVTLTYTQKLGAESDLGVFSLEQSTHRELPYTLGYLEWSPDGKMYIERDHVYSWPTRTLVKDLSSIVPGVSVGRWFRDGKSLLLHTYSPDVGFYRYEFASDVATKIHSEALNGFEISISPDGKLIAFIPVPNDHLVLMDADGGRVASLTIPGATGSYNAIQCIGDTKW